MSDQGKNKMCYRGCFYDGKHENSRREITSKQAQSGSYRGLPCTYETESVVEGHWELACYRGVPFYVRPLLHISHAMTARESHRAA